MKFALAQLTTSDDLDANLATVLRRTRQAAARGADAVLFPENALFMGREGLYRTVARRIVDEDVLGRIAAAAKDARIAVLLGSHIEADGRRLYNTSLWIDERGKTLAKYRKIHLFNYTGLASPRPDRQSRIRVPPVTPLKRLEYAHKNVKTRYRESKNFSAGEKLVTVRWRGITLGLSVCYDVRFPEQYRALAARGATCLFVPSAFTRETGTAHWHALLRARAIENLAFVFAPAQTGTHATGRQTYGHSLAVGPWGEVLRDAGEARRLSFVEFDPKESERRRKSFD